MGRYVQSSRVRGLGQVSGTWDLFIVGYDLQDRLLPAYIEAGLPQGRTLVVRVDSGPAHVGNLVGLIWPEGGTYGGQPLTSVRVRGDLRDSPAVHIYQTEHLGRVVSLQEEAMAEGATFRDNTALDCARDVQERYNRGELDHATALRMTHDCAAGSVERVETEDPLPGVEPDPDDPAEIVGRGTQVRSFYTVEGDPTGVSSEAVMWAAHQVYGPDLAVRGAGSREGWVQSFTRRDMTREEIRDQVGDYFEVRVNGRTVRYTLDRIRVSDAPAPAADAILARDDPAPPAAPWEADPERDDPEREEYNAERDPPPDPDPSAPAPAREEPTRDGFELAGLGAGAWALVLGLGLAVFVGIGEDGGSGGSGARW